MLPHPLLLSIRDNGDQNRPERITPSVFSPEFPDSAAALILLALREPISMYLDA